MDGVTNGGFDYGGNKSPTAKSVIAHHQISYNKIPRFLNQNREERDQRDGTDRSLIKIEKRETREMVLIGPFCHVLNILKEVVTRERERERERES
jgi:hypothetical protein